jgi:ATP-binding cassette subfamily C protein LapB
VTATLTTGLIPTLAHASEHIGQRLPEAVLADLPYQLETPTRNEKPGDLWQRVWELAGLSGKPQTLASPTPADLPLVVWSSEHGWLLIGSVNGQGQWVVQATNGQSILLERLPDQACLSLPRRSEVPPAVAKPTLALSLVGRALWARKGVLMDAVLATCVVNLLTLATSLYSMQVFDRVIPNQGFQTLWVLTVGVALSVMLEFVLKQTRSHTIDKTSNAIDQELSQWFFARMMGIRMEARPTSVGTLAGQVKGFEMVRGVLASTSVFVLADVPFAVLFLLTIALLGGWVAVVPLVTLPIALATGLMFQGLILRHTRLNLAGNNRKVGLLVEAVDGAESLKATGAEWRLQGRWKHLVGEVNQSEQSVRNYSALSQNLTVALQQLSYIALVALGAYLVTENRLSMGGLLACSIIGNRAMTPIVQLPGVMLQWALARAALEGLDQIIALPNEDDTIASALRPQALQGSLRFERIHFAYGREKQLALALERLQISPGECVGLVGPIGSGKSTLLKLASGLFKPTQGNVFLGGCDVALLAPQVVRETVGYLPQDVRLVSGTLRDNLLLGLPDPGDDALLAAARRTGLIDLIMGQARGLALELTEGGRGVSGGQKQLIALTRMLLANPKVWVLDEPVAAMDSVTENRVLSVLREVNAAGATLLVATHKTSLLPLLSRLVVLQNGRVVLDGPRDAVLSKLSGVPPKTNAREVSV